MNNKILYPKIYIIISVLVSLFYVVVQISLFKDYLFEHISLILYCFIPLIFSIIVLITAYYTHKKYPKLTKLIANILNILCLFLHSVFMYYLILFTILFSGIFDPQYDKIEDYQNALSSYKYESVAFFPEKIPDNAQNISLLRTPAGFLGDSTFFIKFDINKEYIQKELQKYQEQGKTVIINEFSQISENKNYDEKKAAVVLDTILKNENSGYKVKILNNDGGCFKGIATKNNTIIYILYLD